MTRVAFRNRTRTFNGSELVGSGLTHSQKNWIEPTAYIGLDFSLLVSMNTPIKGFKIVSQNRK